MERRVRIEVWKKSRRGGMKKTQLLKLISHLQWRDEKKSKRVPIYSQRWKWVSLWLTFYREIQRETFDQDKITSLRSHTDSDFECSCVARLWLMFGPYCNLIWPRTAHLQRKRLSDHLKWLSQVFFLFRWVNIKWIEARFHLRRKKKIKI